MKVLGRGIMSHKIIASVEARVGAPVHASVDTHYQFFILNSSL
jgi:hypothetical protein